MARLNRALQDALSGRIGPDRPFARRLAGVSVVATATRARSGAPAAATGFGQVDAQPESTQNSDLVTFVAACLGDAMGLTDRVSEIVAHIGPVDDLHMARAAATRVLSFESPLAPFGTVDDIVDRVIGLGPLETLIQDDTVTDILVNGPDQIWIDRGGELELTGRSFAGTRDLMATVERAISVLGLRVDRSSPMVEGRLADGSRLHVAIPPAAVDFPVLAIRRFSAAIKSFDQLVASGGATREQVEYLGGAVERQRTILVSGGTGAGKTTLLNLLASQIPATQRLITIEDAAELSFPGHVVRLEARSPNAEGTGEITIRQLLRSALRLRPDRIIVGEVRGAEALDLISALNTGHKGSMSTVHANSPEEAIWRLETLALLDNSASAEAVRRQLHAAVDLVVQLERASGTRSITAIAEIATDGSVRKVVL